MLIKRSDPPLYVGDFRYPPGVLSRKNGKLERGKTRIGKAQLTRAALILIVLAHARRTLLHFNARALPTARWWTQEDAEAFGGATGQPNARYRLREREICQEYLPQRLGGARGTMGVGATLCQTLARLHETHMAHMAHKQIDWVQSAPVFLGYEAYDANPVAVVIDS